MTIQTLFGTRDLGAVEANERLGFKPDQRDNGIGAQILWEIGVRSMRLLCNKPRKLVTIKGYESVGHRIAAPRDPSFPLRSCVI